MSHRSPDGSFVICVEPPGRCEMCGEQAELRPYGVDGANVCFSCAMKNPFENYKRCYMHMGETEEKAAELAQAKIDGHPAFDADTN